MKYYKFWFGWIVVGYMLSIFILCLIYLTMDMMSLKPHQITVIEAFLGIGAFCCAILSPVYLKTLFYNTFLKSEQEIENLKKELDEEIKLYRKAKDKLILKYLEE